MTKTMSRSFFTACAVEPALTLLRPRTCMKYVGAVALAVTVTCISPGLGVLGTTVIVGPEVMVDLRYRCRVIGVKTRRAGGYCGCIATGAVASRVGGRKGGRVHGATQLGLYSVGDTSVYG